MIQLHLKGNNFDLSDKIKDYVEDKIGSLDRYLPRKSREAQGAVTLSIDPSGREDNQCVCEATIKLPGATLQSKEATINMYAAIDIVEAKIKAQLMKYKDKHSPRLNQRQKWLNKVLRRAVEPEV